MLYVHTAPISRSEWAESPGPVWSEHHGPVNDAPTFPLGEFLGMEVTDEGDGHASARVVAGPQHLNPHGFIHGATIFTMVDTSMGAAAMGVLGPDQRCTTIEAQIRFLRPLRAGMLTALTSVVKPGRRVMHLESRVTDDQDRLVATATASFAVVDEAPSP